MEIIKNEIIKNETTKIETTKIETTKTETTINETSYQNIFELLPFGVAVLIFDNLDEIDVVILQELVPHYIEFGRRDMQIIISSIILDKFLTNIDLKSIEDRSIDRSRNKKRKRKTSNNYYRANIDDIDQADNLYDEMNENQNNNENFLSINRSDGMMVMDTETIDHVDDRYDQAAKDFYRDDDLYRKNQILIERNIFDYKKIDRFFLSKYLLDLTVPLDCIERIIKSGCDLNVIGSHPAHYDDILINFVVRAERVDVLRLMVCGGCCLDNYYAKINFGAESNYYYDESFNKTPLEWACILSNYEMVRLLLDGGADPNYDPSIEDDWWEDGQSTNRRRKCGILISVCNSYAKPLDDIIKIIKLLCSSGCDINAIDRYETALHHAIGRNDDQDQIIRLIDQLLDCKADINVNARARIGVTPLVLALELWKDKERIVDRLIERKAVITSCNESNYESIGTVVKRRSTVAQVMRFVEILGPTCITGVACIAANIYRIDILRCLDFNQVDTNDEGSTPLIHLAYGFANGFQEEVIKEIFEFLVAKKQDINHQNDAGHTALTIALNGRNNCLVKLLIDRGACLNASLYDPFAEALNAGLHNLKIARLLIDRMILIGWDFNRRDEQGNDYLMLSIKNERADIFSILLSQEMANMISTKNVNNNGATALISLFICHTYRLPEEPRFYSEEMLKHLIGMSDIHHIDNRGNDALSYAIISSDVQAVELLLEAKSDPNRRDSAGFIVPLYQALANGDGGQNSRIIFDSLVRAKADIGADERGNIPLMWAAEIKGVSISMFSHIIDRYYTGTAHQQDSRGHDVLMLACWDGNNDIVDYLLERGFPIQTSKYGENALTISSIYNQQTVIPVLSRMCGLNPHTRYKSSTRLRSRWQAGFFGRSIRNIMGLNPLMRAIVGGDLSTVKALTRYYDLGETCFGGFTALMLSVICCNLTDNDVDRFKIFSIILKARCPFLDDRDDEGRTALMWASDYRVVARILWCKDFIDVAARDNEGNNALMYAVARRDLDIVKLLYGMIDLKSVNNEGDNVLDMAIKTGSTTEVIEFLLSRSEAYTKEQIERYIELGMVKGSYYVGVLQKYIGFCCSDL